MIKKTDVKLASSGSVAFNFDRKVRLAFTDAYSPPKPRAHIIPGTTNPTSTDRPPDQPTNQPTSVIRACWRWWGRWRRTR